MELRQGEGSLPVVALLLMCSFAATKTGRLKKNHGVSHVTSGSTAMFLLISFESKLCSRQSRRQSLDTWNDTSQWNGHWQAEGRSCGTRKGLCYTAQMAAKNPTPGVDLIILATSDLHPSQLISSLCKRVFQEAGSGARVHG